MTVPSSVVSELGTAGTDLVGMIWQIAPVLIPVTLAIVAVRFIPRFLKSVGK